MPKRISKRPSDVNQAAFLMVERSTHERETEEVLTIPKSVSKVMAMMGSKGGKIGGKRRLKTMTDEERSRVASIAANARWKKRIKP
jgi:hypothetical protein